ncbi:LytTR family DNA-binding domain-containing protein [Spongiivirga sp. MCCC 1A20706]|uniref:LytR/AlgR family response regulator transcription factor n=1 Tax=Spongiivirga sp. MCCC 1A20706 TaxID=3160963 RepID=UPI0039772937
MKHIHILIVDDERLARKELKRTLAGFTYLNIVGEADSADSAKTLLSRTKVDCIFLDIQMPDKSGFDLLEELAITPQIIFTTAYNEYAVRAFEVNALDYLVKPIREERLEAAVLKLKNQIATKDIANKKLSIHQKIFVNDGKRYHFIPLADIFYIKSIENYAQLHFKNERLLIKRSLNSLEEILPDDTFFRINRSEIVNLDFIKVVVPFENNKLKITLKTKNELEISTRRSVLFKKRTRI